MSRLLVISSLFPPRQSAGVYRTLRFVRYLSEMSWDVHVLTIDQSCYEKGSGTDDHLLAKIPSSVAVHRTSAVYPMEWIVRARNCLARPGNRNGIAISGALHGSEPKGTIETTIPPANKGVPKSATIWQRLKDACTVPLMTPDRTLGWLPFATRRGLQLVRRKKIQVLYSSGPPWTNHLVGNLLKKYTGRPWIADFRDPWVNADFNLWRMGDTWAGRMHQRLERAVIANADGIIVNTEGSRADLSNRYGSMVTSKIEVIPNGFDPDDYRSLGHAQHQEAASEVCSGIEPQANNNGLTERRVDRLPELRRNRKLIIAHAGSFYGRRNVDSLIEAVGNLVRNDVLSTNDLEVRLLGAKCNGRRDELDRIEKAGVADSFVVTGMLPHSQCLTFLNEADVLLLVQVGAPISVPGKVFEYIALGKPLLTLASPGATADLVKHEQLGPCVEPDDTKAIEGALVSLVNTFKSNGGIPFSRLDVRERYDGRQLTQRLDAVLRKTIQVPCRARDASRAS